MLDHNNPLIQSEEQYQVLPYFFSCSRSLFSRIFVTIEKKRLLQFSFNADFDKYVAVSNKKFVFTFLGKWKPNDYPFVDNIRAIYLTLEKLIQPEETQVNGIVILVDYGGVGLSQASNPGPLLAKKVVGILQVRHCKSD